jgi:hypothetical protein
MIPHRRNVQEIQFSASFSTLFVLLRLILWRYLLRFPLYGRYLETRYLARRTGQPTWRIFQRIAILSLTGSGTFGKIVDDSISHIAQHGDTPSWLAVTPSAPARK